MQQVVDYMAYSESDTFLGRSFSLERIDIGQDKVPYKTHSIANGIGNRHVDNQFEQQIYAIMHNRRQHTHYAEPDGFFYCRFIHDD